MAIFLCFVQRENICRIRNPEKFRSSLFKGLWVSRGQSPSFALFADSHAFSQLKIVPIPIVAARRPKILSKKKKVCFSEVLSGRNLSCRFLPLSQTVPRTVWEIHLPRAHCVSVQSRKSVKISDALGVRAPFEKGAPKLFLTLSGGDFGKI